MASTDTQASNTNLRAIPNECRRSQSFLNDERLEVLNHLSKSTDNDLQLAAEIGFLLLKQYEEAAAQLEEERLHTSSQEEEIEKLKHKVESLTLDLEEANLDVSNLQSEQGKLQNNIIQLEAQLDSAYRESQTNSKLLAEQDEEIRKLENKLAKDTSTFEQRLAETSKEIERLEDGLRVAQDSEARWKKDIKDLKASLDLIRKENDDLRPVAERAASMEQELKLLRQNVNRVNSPRDSMRSMNSQVEYITTDSGTSSPSSECGSVPKLSQFGGENLKKVISEISVAGVDQETANFISMLQEENEQLKRQVGEEREVIAQLREELEHISASKQSSLADDACDTNTTSLFTAVRMGAPETNLGERLITAAFSTCRDGSITAKSTSMVVGNATASVNSSSSDISNNAATLNIVGGPGFKEALGKLLQAREVEKNQGKTKPKLLVMKGVTVKMTI